jgi:DNA-damage-inducible protein D
MATLGSDAMRPTEDWFLSRTACWLVAMNGDPAKPEIAAAQAYFLVQTRRMELRDQEDAQLSHDAQRIELRERVSDSAKKVSKIAKGAGVRNSSQPFFHDARYQGLYQAPLNEVKRRKGLPQTENLMDRAGPLELSMNEFQMNLAADVISREGIHYESRAIQRNREVAQRLRRVIEESDGMLPEDLPIEAPIKEVKRRLSASKKLPSPD